MAKTDALENRHWNSLNYTVPRLIITSPEAGQCMTLHLFLLTYIKLVWNFHRRLYQLQKPTTPSSSCQSENTLIQCDAPTRADIICPRVSHFWIKHYVGLEFHLPEPKDSKMSKLSFYMSPNKMLNENWCIYKMKKWECKPEASRIKYPFYFETILPGILMTRGSIYIDKEGLLVQYLLFHGKQAASRLLNPSISETLRAVLKCWNSSSVSKQVSYTISMFIQVNFTM